jgi:hypothetical protein
MEQVESTIFFESFSKRQKRVFNSLKSAKVFFTTKF